MPRLTDVADRLLTTDTVLDMVTTLEEVAVLRMQRVRNSVLKTRGYLEGLLDVFVSVRLVHQREIDQLHGGRHWWQGRQPSAKTTVRNGKTIIVLVSPSQRLSGEVGRRVYHEFETALEKQTGQFEVAIVGKMGHDRYVSQFQREPDLYLDWQEHADVQDDLPGFLASLVDYEKVIVFTAEFQSLVTQQPKQLILTGNEELTAKAEGPVSNQMYLCEPTIGELVDFFEHQVVASLFQQSLQEARLAHLGSRVTALESATQTVTTEKSKLRRAAQQLERQEQQRRQRQRLAGMQLWQH